MRKLIYTAIIAIATTACGNDKASKPVKPNEINDDIAEAGREAALRALEYDSCSQARDSALLEIRATEQRLRMEGMPNSAKSYAAGAQSVVDSLTQK
jgi:hypothetical protein